MFEWGHRKNRHRDTNGTGTTGNFTRSQHLDSYVNDPTLKGSTRKIPPGDAKYDTVFQTVDGNTLILRVSIENMQLPSMLLEGVEARHPWLDGRMRVTGYGPLQSESAWKRASMLLGSAVHNVVQELQVRPPEIVRIVDPRLQRIQTKSNGKAPAPAPAASRTANHTPPQDPPNYSTFVSHTPSIDMPAIPSQFRELNSLDREELDKLLENELDLQAFCSQLPTAKTLQKMSVSVVDDNAKTAEKNLQHETDLKELHSKATLLQKQLRQTTEEFATLEIKQNKLCQPPDQRKIIRDLTKAKKEAFDNSERFADEWLENDGEDVDTFVKKFLEERKKHHERAAKLELLESSRRR